MSLQAHYDTLEGKRSKLKVRIADELNHPQPDLSLIQTLKKQKLLLKEELERLRHVQHAEAA